MKDFPEGHIIESALRAEVLSVAIVATRWNDLIVSRSVSGAQHAFRRLDSY